ncbi:cell division protein FtsQ/DivIB [Cellulomonas edaphi]|uniref:Cell division protein FtsQ/DivIB n=1 Tax=Cellulomonas edaphi TaxID=3053468 RepID=A0ABT7S8R2_9CELL|nr:cell division protein FtsQ/DivIB [Cellulomons edaphi]MDM7832018.1 cell division protein FtsQ/DivIB [Cellulomons edaphi]
MDRPTAPTPRARAAEADRPSTGPIATAAAPAPVTGPQRNVSTYSASGRRLSGSSAEAPVVSSTSLARFAERARARRTLARRQIVLVVGGLAAVLGLGWLLFFSPVLALDTEQVTVAGAGSVVAVEKVEAVVDARAGVPLPRLDTVTMRDEILDVPGVREARVMRDWPHGVSVTLVAREPVAAVPDEARFALLDMDGVQVGRVDKAPKGLPVVDVPVGEKRTLGAVLAVLEQLPDDLLKDVRTVAAQTQDTVTMTLRDGVKVHWGSAARTPLKIAVLSTILESKPGKDAKVVDVSAPELPVTR